VANFKQVNRIQSASETTKPQAKSKASNGLSPQTSKNKLTKKDSMMVRGSELAKDRKDKGLESRGVQAQSNEKMQ